MPGRRGDSATFEQGLARCTSFEDVANLIIAEVATLMGVPPFTVQQLREAWAQVPVGFDQLDELAGILEQRLGGQLTGGTAAGAAAGTAAAEPAGTGPPLTPPTEPAPPRP